MHDKFLIHQTVTYYAVIQQHKTNENQETEIRFIPTLFDNFKVFNNFLNILSLFLMVPKIIFTIFQGSKAKRHKRDIALYKSFNKILFYLIQNN